VLRSAFRSKSYPYEKLYGIGFRTVLSVNPSAIAVRHGIARHSPAGGAPVLLAETSGIIRYFVPHRGHVTMAIMGVQGRGALRMLVDKQQNTGSYRISWRGHESRPHAGASSAYLCVLSLEGKRIAAQLLTAAR
jgi:hypothetical protein